MTMLRPIIVATIFNAILSTKCYEQPVWNNLVVLKKSFPHDADALPPFKRMAPTPYSRYEIQPGSHGLFSDIAQGIQTRMKGIAKGPFIVVFDYGGIAPKYFSIIEDMASGSGVKVGPIGTVMVEPPGIAEHVTSGDERVTSEGKPLETQRYLKPAATAVTPTEETFVKTLISIPEDEPPKNGGVTSSLKRIEAEPSTTELLTTSTIKSVVETIEDSPVHNLYHDDSSAANGIVSMMKLIMTHPPSTLNATTSPSSTAVTLESFTTEENIPSTTNTVMPIEGEQSLPNEPIATRSSVEPVDGALGKPASGTELGKSDPKDFDDGVTSIASTGGRSASTMKPIMTNLASTVKENTSLSSTTVKLESFNAEENTPPNMGTPVTADGEWSLLNDDIADTLKSIQAEPLAITLPIASTVSSTISTTAKTPVSILKDESIENDWVTSKTKRIEAKPSKFLPTASTESSAVDTNLNTLVSVFKHDSSTTEGLTSTVERTEATLPKTSARETIMEVPVSIPKDDSTRTAGIPPKSVGVTNMETQVSAVNEDSSKSYGIKPTSRKTHAETSKITLPTLSAVESTVDNIMHAHVSTLNGNDSSADVGPTSMTRPIVMNPASVSKEIILSSPTVATRQSINAGETIPLLTNTAVNIEGERSPYNDDTAIEPYIETEDGTPGMDPSLIGQSKLKNIAVEPSAITLPMDSEVTSTVDTIVEAPVSILKHDSSTNDWMTSTPRRFEENLSTKTLQTASTDSSIVDSNLNTLAGIRKNDSPINYRVPSTPKSTVVQPSITSQPTASTSETTVDTTVDILKDDWSTINGMITTPKWIEEKPSQATLSTVSTTLTTAETPVNILEDDSSANDRVKIMKVLLAKPPTTPRSASTETAVRKPISNLNGSESSSGRGIPSIKKLTSNTLKAIDPPSSSVAALESINAEEHTVPTTNTVLSIEGKRSLPNEPPAIELYFKTADMAPGSDHSGIGPSHLKSTEAKPSTTILPTLSAESSTVDTYLNTVISILKDDSTANDGLTSTPTRNEAKLSITKRPTATANIAETRVGIPKDDSSTNDGTTNTSKSFAAQHSIATLPLASTTETPVIAETPGSILQDSSIKGGVTSTLKVIVAKPSTATPQRTSSETTVNTPVSILNDNNSSSGGEIAPTIKLSMMNPANGLKTITSLSSTAATLESVNDEGNIPTTTNTVLPIEGERSLPIEPTPFESSVKTLDMASGKDSSSAGLSQLKSTEAKPSVVTLPTASTKDIILETPVSILEDGSSTKDAVTSTLEVKVAKPSTSTTQRASSQTVVNMPVGLNDDNSLSSPGGGITSTAKVIVTDTSGDLRAITSPSSTTATLESINAEGNIPSTKNTIVAIEDEQTLPSDPTAIDTTVKTLDMASSKPPSGIGLGTTLLKRITDGVTTSIASAGSGIASMINLIMKSPDSALMDIASPSSTATTLESISTEEDIQPTTSTVLSNEGEQSLPHAIESSVNTADMASGNDHSGIGPSQLKSTEAKPSTIILPTISAESSTIDTYLNTLASIAKDDSTTNHVVIPTPMRIGAKPSITTQPTASTDIVETRVSIPKDDSSANDGMTTTFKSIVAQPSIATLPTASIKEIMAETPGSILQDDSSMKGGVTSTVKVVVTKPSTPTHTPHTTRKVIVLNTPISIVNDDDSSTGGGIAPTMKLSVMKPANGLKTITSTSSTTATSISAEENIPLTMGMVVPIEGGRSLSNGLNDIEPSVKPVDVASGKNPSGIGLSRSLLKGIADGVTTSIASAGSGIASMMKLIMTKPASALKDITSQSTTAATLEYLNAEENVPSNINTVVTTEGERSLPLATASESLMETANWASGKDPSGIGLSASLLQAIANGVKNGVDGMKAIEFPGKTSIALLYPDHHVSVADKSTNEIMHFTPLSNVELNAPDAQALYVSLKPVTTEVSFIIKSRGFNCVPLKLTKLHLNLYVVDSIVFGEGNICGLENMQPGNTVTITKDDEDVMDVTMPLILKDLTVKINSVDVSNYFFTLIEGQPIGASVKEISCKGTFSFRKGTPFELTSFRMEWGDITGVHIKLEGALEEGSPVSGIIDNIASALSGLIKSFISPILDQIEKQITKSILGR